MNKKFISVLSYAIPILYISIINLFFNSYYTNKLDVTILPINLQKTWILLNFILIITGALLAVFIDLIGDRYDS